MHIQIPPRYQPQRIGLRVAPIARIQRPAVIEQQITFVVKVLAFSSDVQLDHLLAKLRVVVHIVAAVGQVAQLALGESPASVPEVPRCDGRLVVTERTVAPLPYRPVGCICHAPGRVQVVCVHRVSLPVDDRAYKDVSLLRGQVDVFRAAGALGAAGAVFAQQVCAFVHEHRAQLGSVVLAGGGEQPLEPGLQPFNEALAQYVRIGLGLLCHGFAFEHALAQGVVQVQHAHGLAVLVVAQPRQAAAGIVFVGFEAIAGLVACGVQCVAHIQAGAGLRDLAGVGLCDGLAETQQAVAVVGYCVVALGGQTSTALACVGIDQAQLFYLARAVAVEVVAEGFGFAETGLGVRGGETPSRPPLLAINMEN